MKKILNTIIILSLFGLISCNDWLELDTVGSKTTDNYIKDYASAVSAYNGVHEVYLNLYSGLYQVMLDVASDDAFTRPPANASDIKVLDQLNFSEGTGAAYYGTCYTGISRINTAIPRAEALLGSKESEQLNHILGQFYFMRGYFYFTLVKLYGQVPIVPEITSVEDAKQPRASFDNLYALIESDLLKSSELMASALDNTVGKEYGKPYKYVAHMALADFYLYFEKWQQAKTQADIIISSGKFAKVPYNVIFNQQKPELGITYSATYNKEVLLDAYYAEEKKQGFTWRLTPLGRNIEREGHHLAVAYCTQNDLLLHDDDGLIPYKGKNGGLGIMDEIEDGDARLTAFFWEDYITNPNVSGYTGCIKHDGISYSPNATVNYPVYRYSELLLIKAEAENELNNLSAAKQIIDTEIRGFAGLPASAANSKEAMRMAILKERRIELAWEAKRFFDLNRMGLASEYLERRQIAVAQGGLSKHEITNPITGKQNVVFSLPLGEINANPFIDSNNPGY